MRTSRYIFLIVSCFVFIGLTAVWVFASQPITIHARIVEDGGFMPNNIRARVGKPLKLRLIADDVVHTFAVGQNPMPPVLLKPNEPVEFTLTFDKPGVYTFYTTTPSSMNFWRMRGTIEVIGDADTKVSEPPLYVQLGLNLDAEHGSEMGNTELARQPSASRGATFVDQIPSTYLTRDYYVAHSPMETFEELRAESVLRLISDAEIWDIVAYVWQQNVSSTSLTDGQRLYQANCAACHGKNGAGDGQFADAMKAIAKQNKNEHGIQAPTDFMDAEHLLESKPAAAQGIILRGGMGTGMPMWGAIFTEDQTWSLVAYLYSFQFEYQGANQ